MFLRQLFEAPQDAAVFAFGRMNPPTIGHQKLVEKIKSLPGAPFVFLSQTQKPKTDPLDFVTKLKFAQKFFPDVTVGDQKVRTIIQAMQYLEQQGFQNVIYVAGSDRVDSFDELLNKYNGKEYNFNSIKVVNAGARDPDKEGAEGMSASKMREAAATGNFEAFAQGVPDKRLAEELYKAVRNGMGVKDKELEPQESVNEAEYQGEKVTLDSPIRVSGEDHAFKVYVKNDKGNVVKVTFGDPDMPIQRDDKESRENFKSRHNCSSKKDKTTAGYWSCKAWETGTDWV
jgi:hypothetical protein